MGWLCRCAGTVWKPIWKRAHTQLVREHSPTVILARWARVDWSWPKEWNLRARPNLYFQKKKKRRQKIIAEHFPQIVTCKGKAITTTILQYCKIVVHALVCVRACVCVCVRARICEISSWSSLVPSTLCSFDKQHKIVVIMHSRNLRLVRVWLTQATTFVLPSSHTHRNTNAKTFFFCFVIFLTVLV